MVWFVCYSLGICKTITLLQWDRKTLKPDAKIKLLSVPHSPESHLKPRIFDAANGGGICIISWNY